MQRENNKPKVRFTRNEDGSLRIPESISTKNDDLTEIWGQQKVSLDAPSRSLKEEISIFRDSWRVQKNEKTRKKLKNPTINPNKTKFNSTATRQVAITFKLPNLHRLLIHFRINKMRAITAVVLIMAISGVAWFVFSHKDGEMASTNNGEVAGAVTSNIQTNVTPSFSTMTPNGQGVSDLGGFANIAPKNEPAVYAYKDTIRDIKIIVSQQQLPDDLRSDQSEKLKQLAEGFNAKTSLEVGDNTAYIGASADGAQSVVYIKGENLVLIASEQTIPNSDWVTYIGNLKY